MNSARACALNTVFTKHRLWIQRQCSMIFALPLAFSYTICGMFHVWFLSIRSVWTSNTCYKNRFVFIDEDHIHWIALKSPRLATKPKKHELYFLLFVFSRLEKDSAIPILSSKKVKEKVFFFLRIRRPHQHHGKCRVVPGWWQRKELPRVCHLGYHSVWQFRRCRRFTY